MGDKSPKNKEKRKKRNIKKKGGKPATVAGTTQTK